MNDVQVNLVMPKELYKKIKEVAKNKNISMAAFIRMVMSEYISSKE